MHSRRARTDDLFATAPDWPSRVDGLKGFRVDGTKDTLADSRISSRTEKILKADATNDVRIPSTWKLSISHPGVALILGAQ